MDFDSILKPYIGLVDQIAALIPYKRVKVWRSFFDNPTSTLSASKADGFGMLIDLYALMGIGLFIDAFAAWLPAIIVGFITGGLMGAGITIGLTLLSFIFMPLLYMLYTGLEYGVAKLIGGKADFAKHANASLLPMISVFIVLLPLAIITIPLAWVSYVPMAICLVAPLLLVVSIIQMIGGVYSLYLKFVALKAVHKVGDIHSVAIIIVPFLIVFAVLAAIVLAIYMLGLGALLAGGALLGGLGNGLVPSP